jgi:hypothetical protein
VAQTIVWTGSAFALVASVTLYRVRQGWFEADLSIILMRIQAVYQEE